MTRRITWSVRPAKLLGWKLTRDEGHVERVEWYPFKFAAVRAGRKYCRKEWADFKTLGELRIANRKGVVTVDGSTYGNDPKRTRG